MAAARTTERVGCGWGYGALAVRGAGGGRLAWLRAILSASCASQHRVSNGFVVACVASVALCGRWPSLARDTCRSGYRYTAQGSGPARASPISPAKGAGRRPPLPRAQRATAKPCTIYRSRSTLKLRIIYSAYGGKDNKVSKLYWQAADYR